MRSRVGVSRARGGATIARLMIGPGSSGTADICMLADESNGDGGVRVLAASAFACSLVKRNLFSMSAKKMSAEISASIRREVFTS